ncbi:MULTISPECIES: hypothetical protein [Streptomyces]|uniref:hypothetical protein n=1 Tax=Streptomyces TaxID=1883 RepID=UPI00114CDFD1|nr:MULTISPECIES: hypothetical protein [Streptomyces]
MTAHPVRTAVTWRTGTGGTTAAPAHSRAPRPQSPPEDPPGPGGGAGGDADGGWFGRHQRAAWIGVAAAVVTAVATIVAALIPVVASSDAPSDSGPTGAAAPAPSTTPVSAPATEPAESAPASAPASASEQAGTTGPGPGTPPAGSEHWRGRLLIDSEPKDLDAEQPVAVGYADEGDIFTIGADELGGWNGTVISLWSGKTASLPGFEECASTVGAAGTDTARLAGNAVLCVRTSDGNIARLQLTELEVVDRRATFDTVIWAAG